MTDEERQKLLLDLRRQSTDDLFGKAADEIKRLAALDFSLETAADLIERLAHELVSTNERLEQLEARVEALERM